MARKKPYSLKHGILFMHFLQKTKNKKNNKKKGRGRIVSSVIENLLEMRPNRPK